MAMNITYYNPSTGERQIKRRYKWAACAFLAGVVFGEIAAHLL